MSLCTATAFGRSAMTFLNSARPSSTWPCRIKHRGVQPNRVFVGGLQRQRALDSRPALRRSWPPRNSVSAGRVANARTIRLELEGALGRLDRALGPRFVVGLEVHRPLRFRQAGMRHRETAGSALSAASNSVKRRLHVAGEIAAIEEGAALPVRNLRRAAAGDRRRRFGRLARRRLIGDGVAQQRGQPLLQLEQIAGRRLRRFRPTPPTRRAARGSTSRATDRAIACTEPVTR